MQQDESCIYYTLYENIYIYIVVSFDSYKINNLLHHTFFDTQYISGTRLKCHASATNGGHWPVLWLLVHVSVPRISGKNTKESEKNPPNHVLNQTTWYIISLIMAYLTFPKWLVSVCNIHNDIWMIQTKTSHLGKVSYAIILLDWWCYYKEGTENRNCMHFSKIT